MKFVIKSAAYKSAKSTIKYRIDGDFCVGKLALPKYIKPKATIPKITKE